MGLLPLSASPGARAYYDQLRARGANHHAALRQLGNRVLIGEYAACTLIASGSPVPSGGRAQGVVGEHRQRWLGGLAALERCGSERQLAEYSGGVVAVTQGTEPHLVAAVGRRGLVIGLGQTPS
jgi:hypothetical protein